MIKLFLLSQLRIGKGGEKKEALFVQYMKVTALPKFSI